tara:strand:- start:2413 stop:3087 length:675 start_codon:yes stop_codon:yes gene_type:complete
MISENILYSFRRCPFAIRARWAILKNKIKVNLREVDLKQKPPELIELSPKGTVPVLNTSTGSVIDQSLDIIKWSILNSSINNQKSNDLKINCSKANDLIELNDREFKYHLDRFKYASRYKHNNTNYHQEKALLIIRSLNCRLSKSKNKGFKGWLMEDCESIADWAIWPFIRQYVIADPKIFDRDKGLSYLRDWLNSYTGQTSFKIVMKKYKRWESKDIPISFGI